MSDLYEVSNPQTTAVESAPVAAAPAAPATGFNLGNLIIDEQVAAKGTWVDWFSGSALLLSSTSSNAYKAKVAKLARAKKLLLDDANPENVAAIQDITCEALATTVLLDWRGIHIPDQWGVVQQNVKYTPAIGKEMLLKVDPLRDFVSEQAAKAENFKKQTVDLAKKP
jgi:hypothetical protein